MSQAAADRQSVGSRNVPAAAACGSEFHCGCTPFELSVQGAACAPLIDRDRPVAVLPQLQRLSAGVANLDDIAGHREVEEPLGVVGVQAQAPARGVRTRIRRVSAHIQRAGAVPCQPSGRFNGIAAVPRGSSSRGDVVAALREAIESR
jgi:hypothetical protein